MSYALIGWIATAVYLANHACLSIERGYPRRLYYLLNFFAAGGLVISSLVIASWQPVAVNVFWAVVSLLALAGMSLKTGSGVSQKWLLWPLYALVAAALLLLAFDWMTAIITLGWAGTFLFCAAYLFFSGGIVRRRRFLLLNLIAACLLMPVLYLHQNWPVLALEAAWAVISLAGWLRAQRLPPLPDAQ